MTPPNIDLIEMADSSVAGGDGYVFELDVHVVFGYAVGAIGVSLDTSIACAPGGGTALVGELGETWTAQRTFDKLAPVDLTGRDLKSYNMVL